MAGTNDVVKSQCIIPSTSDSRSQDHHQIHPKFLRCFCRIPVPHSKSSDSLRRQSIFALLMTPLLVGLHAIAVRAMAVLANVAIAVLANVAFEVLANVAIAILALAHICR